MSLNDDHLLTTRLMPGGVIEVSYDGRVCGTVWTEEGPTGLTGEWGKWWENSAVVGKYLRESSAVNDLLWRTNGGQK
jgi:hypothetical protein